jgi:hypothetical protein
MDLDGLVDGSPALYNMSITAADLGLSTVGVYVAKIDSICSISDTLVFNVGVWSI